MDGDTTAEQPQQSRPAAAKRSYRGRHRPVDDLGRPSPFPRPRNAIPVTVNGRRRWYATMTNAPVTNAPMATATTADATVAGA